MFMTVFEFGCVKCELISDLLHKVIYKTLDLVQGLGFGLKNIIFSQCVVYCCLPPLTFMCMLMQFLHILCNRPNGRHLWQAGDCKTHSFASTLYAADFSTR